MPWDISTIDNLIRMEKQLDELKDGDLIDDDYINIIRPFLEAETKKELDKINVSVPQ